MRRYAGWRGDSAATPAAVGVAATAALSGGLITAPWRIEGRQVRWVDPASGGDRRAVAVLARWLRHRRNLGREIVLLLLDALADHVQREAVHGRLLLLHDVG